MENKKLLFFAFYIVPFLLLIGNENAFSQSVNKSETFEEVYGYWFNAIDKFQSVSGVNNTDFGVFSRFSQKEVDSIRGGFMGKIGNGEITIANVKSYEDTLVNGLATVYKKFKELEERYPSSVDEYRNYRPFLPQVCDSACNNIDFETGNLSGWYAYYAYNGSGTTSNNIELITGGQAGAVTQAANDVLTSTSGYYVTEIGPNPRPDYQVNIVSGSRGDAIVPSVPVVSPFGGRYSVMLGDSTELNYGVAILSQTFLVSKSNDNFTYQYAVFLENPGHNYYQQPFFRVALLDQSGDTIPYCGSYTVISGHGTQSFDSIEYYDPQLNETSLVYYKNWTIVNVPLVHYIGQCVTVVFESADCALGGHFGYAYIDASCSSIAIISSSRNFCGQDSIVLTGPAGEGHYSWTGPTGGIRSNDTLSQISIDSAGTYTLVVTPFTGASCNDTLTIDIGKKTGSIPHPNFTADTGCTGLSTAFLNSSNPITGGKFDWDFYNSGTYESSSVDPTWIYNLPGVYTVKLHELYEGCGADTTIQVVIDSVVNSLFIDDTVCYGDTTRFTNMSTGSTSYYWNFGDPSSGINNTSENANPGHCFSAPGSYTVSYIGMHPHWCNDTFSRNIEVLPLPKPIITGSDSICSGDTAMFSVSGGTSYLWSTGATTTSIKVGVNSPATYSVAVNNGTCTDDTTFNVFLKPLANGTLTGANVCLNDTIHLAASGGGTYLWNTGSTSSSINVPAKSMNDTSYWVSIKNDSSCVTIRKDITIYPLPTVSACCDDTIFAGTSVVLNATGGGSYYWIPPTGLSCDTCPNPTASPTVNTLYKVVITNAEGCSVESFATIDVIIPCKDFFIPNVFTPNGDGVNDTYLIKAEYMSAYEISIYNRWGKLVFHSLSPANPWDGTVNGTPASAGIYYYILRATCINGNSFNKHGYLELVR